VTRFPLIFMGSPEFAVPTLEALLAREDVRAVVTQPDRPRGRGRALAPPPVKEVAAAAGIPVLQPTRLKDNHEIVAALSALEPVFAIVVAYGRILPPALLTLPARGCLNVHASLLPRYRGAAPIQWAIAGGEHETGVTIMRLDEGMDTGPVVLERREPIAEDDTAGSLAVRLARLGAVALADALDLARGGLLPEAPQDPSAATYAPLLAKDQGRVDFGQPARTVRDWIRAMDPWPGAWTILRGEPLRLFAPRLVSGRGEPGLVLGADRDGLLVACGDGAIGIGELQLPSRKRMPARALLAGQPIASGTVLGG
jgi:methionyl-tRNA formyltransferase